MKVAKKYAPNFKVGDLIVEYFENKIDCVFYIEKIDNKKVFWETIFNSGWARVSCMNFNDIEANIKDGCFKIFKVK